MYVYLPSPRSVSVRVAIVLHTVYSHHVSIVRVQLYNITSN